jgi:RNA binding exosome subunit
LAPDAIAYIDIRVFSHATEDENKIIEAVKKILPADHLEKIVLEKHTLHGHYGNPITFFETRIKDKEVLKAIVENLSSHLNTLDKEELRSRISEYSEKGSLYIRLDKQAAFEGEFKLEQVDPVRIHVRFTKGDVVKICQELGIMA